MKINKVEIKKIRTHWDVDYGFSLLGYLGGLAVYPVEYKHKKYYIELLKSSPGILCHLYEYGDEKKLFFGHKRSLLWKKNFISVVLEDGERIFLTTSALLFSAEQKIKLHLPEIIKAILVQYELEKHKKKEQNRIIADNMNWDGVVEVGLEDNGKRF